MDVLDLDGDGRLSAREFIRAASRHPVIAELIDGKCS